MTEDATTPTEPRQLVPAALLEATRSLLWIKTEADARRIAEELVRGLGGTLVPADTIDVDALPADVAFGAGEPLLPSAPPGSGARALLERHLTPFLLDARRALLLSGQTERLAEDASTDALTGLPNRRALVRALSRLSGEDTVVLLDLDHFKRVNDELGHSAGDAVLRAFGAVLRATVRGRDVVGRLGGEEFVVVVASPTGAEIFLDRLRAEWVANRPELITFSAGITHAVGDAEATLARADEALYQAKGAGRDRWSWSTGPTDEQAREGTDR
ncbi:MAG: GGDEF domain-containing protein [Acidimicrobiia bacterium]